MKEPAPAPKRLVRLRSRDGCQGKRHIKKTVSIGLTASHGGVGVGGVGEAVGEVQR